VSAQDTFGMSGGEEEYQHSAPVVQVESVSAYQVQYAFLLRVFVHLVRSLFIFPNFAMDRA